MDHDLEGKRDDTALDQTSADQTAGRVALALAQVTLSMLTATRTLPPEVVRAVAAGVAGYGSMELTKEEASLLSKIIHGVLEE